MEQGQLIQRAKEKQKAMTADIRAVKKLNHHDSHDSPSSDHYKSGFEKHKQVKNEWYSEGS